VIELARAELTCESSLPCGVINFSETKCTHATVAFCCDVAVIAVRPAWRVWPGGGARSVGWLSLRFQIYTATFSFLPWCSSPLSLSFGGGAWGVAWVGAIRNLAGRFIVLDIKSGCYESVRTRPYIVLVVGLEWCIPSYQGPNPVTIEFRVSFFYTVV
jgi:hypothetical protein